MKNRVFLILFASLNLSVTHPENGQKVVKWDCKLEKLSTTDFYITMTAAIDTGWFLFSYYCPSDDGYPFITTVRFEDNKNSTLNLIGDMEEILKPKERIDQITGGILSYYELKAVLRQRIKLLKSEDGGFTVKLEYMPYSNSRAFPPEIIEFQVVTDKKGMVVIKR